MWLPWRTDSFQGLWDDVLDLHIWLMLLSKWPLISHHDQLCPLLFSLHKSTSLLNRKDSLYLFKHEPHTPLVRKHWWNVMSSFMVRSSIPTPFWLNQLNYLNVQIYQSLEFDRLQFDSPRQVDEQDGGVISLCRWEQKDLSQSFALHLVS